ncbi:hypothetical protein ACFQY0_01505 [Haloferula chungangensis]|uniref:Uncharacterized protein n=1 Tax=Haloferula chungangensis TaxID=1048331 RepID=A0ABW2L2Y5_9BACT
MENHQLNVERMRLSLPSEMRGKERTFAQHLAGEFGRLRVSEDTTIEKISLPPITYRPGESAALLAKRVAQELSHVMTKDGNHETQGGRS